MSKRSKHDEKMARKRAAKAAKRAQYAALAGTSKKKKRQVSKTSVAGILKHAHAMKECGNPGCQKCNPRKMLHGASKLGQD
jgi:hypothetical protein